MLQMDDYTTEELLNKVIHPKLTSRDRFFRLLNADTLRGVRFSLAMLSFGWSMYLISPLVRFNFLNMAGAAMFLLYAVQILIELIFANTVKISEGLQGSALWAIGISYHYSFFGIDDTLFVLWVPLTLSWWVLGHGLARLKTF